MPLGQHFFDISKSECFRDYLYKVCVNSEKIVDQVQSLARAEVWNDV